jgi:hypothetical protein
MVGHPMATMPSLLHVLVVKFVMFVEHTNLSPSPVNPKFPTLVVGHMWARQHGMDGLLSCPQMELGHNLHPSFPLIVLTSSNVLSNLANMVTPFDPTPHAKYWTRGID